MSRASQWAVLALGALFLGRAAWGAPQPPPQAPAAPAASPLHLDVALAQGKNTVGDRIEALLTLRVPTAELVGEPRFPAWGDSWGDAEILEKGAPAKLADAGGTAVYRQRLVLTGWRPGQVALPPVAAAVPLRSATLQAATPAGLALTFISVLPPKKPGDKDPQPKPPAPPRPLPWGMPFGWTVLALSLACLGLGYLLWRRGRARSSVAAGLVLAPLAELYQGLEGLAAEPSAVRLHTRLSLALRTYLGRTLAFPAAESTTSEIHRQLLARHLPAALLRRWVELLRACDLVKFARQEVGEERSRERLAEARELGRELDVYLTPPALEEAGDALSQPLEKAG